MPAALLLFTLSCLPLVGQDAAQKPAEKPAAKNAEKPSTPEKAINPAQIELLETKVRFETNGDSRKEVHALVKINSELGVRQFARLNFDSNRSFESVEIPFLHITHESGGTADILPSAITDQPNPAVVNAPAYQDMRVKSVRILGLQPGDKLEYRVIKTVSHHPLAPDFWLDHTFDRTGIVSKEIFEIDLPASLKPKIQINPATPPTSTDRMTEKDEPRLAYRWEETVGSLTAPSPPATKSAEAAPDVVFSTFANWEQLSIQLASALTPGAISLATAQIEDLKAEPKVPAQVAAKAKELTRAANTEVDRARAIYDFVAQKIRSVDLGLGSTGFSSRSADSILSSGYATQEDKFVLIASLAKAAKLSALPVLRGSCGEASPPRPSIFNHLLVILGNFESRRWTDPSLEVAPFGMIRSSLEKCGFGLSRAFYLMNSRGRPWILIPTRLPFAASQRVNVVAVLEPNGKLSAKVRYAMRGDNELVLRVAFHRTPKERWREVAQLLSITDGFRGQVTSVSVSDPFATKDPFTLEYELEQPKFVDWSKKTVRIPALLPQLGLPDAGGKPATSATASQIELGTPLEVRTEMTLQLPPGTTASAPAGTSVERDYATYSSQYTVKGSTVTASRHIHFLLRVIPATRAADYNAFLHAVQSDEAQDFTLEKKSGEAPAAKPAENKKPSLK